MHVLSLPNSRGETVNFIIFGFYKDLIKKDLPLFVYLDKFRQPTPAVINPVPPIIKNGRVLWEKRKWATVKSTSHTFDASFC